MTSKTIYINPEIIVRHIDPTDLDLTDLPSNQEEKEQLRLLGIVTRCRPDENYAFVVTNEYGIKDSHASDDSVTLFLDKREWKGANDLQENLWITFELKKQPKRERHAAVNATNLTLTLEDYNICKNYLGSYGIIRGERYNESIETTVYNMFFSSIVGRQLVLTSIYQRKSTDYYEWKCLLSSMTEEERDSFVLNTEVIEPTAELRIYLYKYLNSIDWINNPVFISALFSRFDSKKVIFDLLTENFKSEEDKNTWIDYAKRSNLSSDILLAELFLFTFNTNIYDLIADKKLIITAINRALDIDSDLLFHNELIKKVLTKTPEKAVYKGKDKIIKYLGYCINSQASDEICALFDSLNPARIKDVIKMMDDKERAFFLENIPNNKVVQLILDNEPNTLALKAEFLSSKKGRQAILNDLYDRKSNDCDEWNFFLSHLPEDEQKSFELNTDFIKPTAELRICLYKYTWSLDWLKHPSVIALISKPDNDSELSLKHLFEGFHNNDDKNEWLNYVKGCSISDDNLKASIFYLTENFDFYKSIGQKSIVTAHINNADLQEVLTFLKNCYNNLNDEELLVVINSLSNDRFTDALKRMSFDDSYQLLCRLPEDQVLGIVTKDEFKGGELFKTYIGKLWDTLKGELPYCVFDLESDGESIKEFAFYAEDYMSAYTGEDQIKSLLRRLKKTPIIVGHNVKLWDLPILQKKGLELPNDTFVWDTLEIEILLNPCRYAYSLHTEHNAEADTKLTNDLFWNQLYRLSVDDKLVEQLREVLPDNIGKIINSLHVDYFSEYFKYTANLNQQFFQELRPLDDELVEKLNAIAEIPETEETLIIAPSNLWARLAQYIPLSFPCTVSNSSFRSINIDILKEKPFGDVVKQAILERFCTVSKTPIVENLAQYLRVVGDDERKLSFSEEDLQGYLCRYQSHIDCVDVGSFENEDVISRNYKHIYIIGTELEDRVHKCKACENKSFADLIALGSNLPFTMASTNYAPVKGEEINKLGITMPNHAANIWAERERNSEFAFYLNYQYQAYRNAFLAHFTAKPKKIKWKFKGGDVRQINLTQVCRNRTAEMVMRVNTSTTQRSKYWLFQIALLSKIHQANLGLPIIYVINDKKEIEGLTKYAAAQGFFIPSSGNGFRKLEYIGSHPNGMVIISKQEFVDSVGAYRTDKPFCYVWDNMDIDRCMLMWDKLPFDDDLEEDSGDERDDKMHHTTPRQCIHAAWPIYEHYCSLVMANSKNTQFYIIDPHFDDYEGIADSCKANSFKVDLWENDEDYKKALGDSSQYFDDSRGKEEDIDTVKALELIRKHFIGDNNWKPTQNEVLPHIWEKRGDCIVSMPTGEGKSVCFQGPALYKASLTKKLSLVITPLRALMQDQVEDLQKKGFATNVDYLSGDRQRPEVESIYRKLRSGEIALLYITPERFRVKSFMNVLYQRMEMDGGLEYIIFDEAHCISQWGQEFRPDYRNAVLTCVDLRQRFDFMFALFSATVTTQVESDIRSFLPDILRLGQTADDYNPIRQHIGISFALTEHEDASRIDEIVRFIEDQKIDFTKSCMIVFCRTHRQCEETADTLSEIASKASPDSILHNCIDKIGFYHAGLDADLRNDVYEQFKRKDGVEPL